MYGMAGCPIQWLLEMDMRGVRVARAMAGEGEMPFNETLGTEQHLRQCTVDDDLFAACWLGRWEQDVGEHRDR